MYDLCSNGPYDQEEEETKGVGERARPTAVLAPSPIGALGSAGLLNLEVQPLAIIHTVRAPRLLDVPEPKLEIALAEHWRFLNPFTSGGAITPWTSWLVRAFLGIGVSICSIYTRFFDWKTGLSVICYDMFGRGSLSTAVQIAERKKKGKKIYICQFVLAKLDFVESID